MRIVFYFVFIFGFELLSFEVFVNILLNDIDLCVFVDSGVFLFFSVNIMMNIVMSSILDVVWIKVDM